MGLGNGDADRYELAAVTAEAARSGGRREAIEHMLRQEFGGGVDALEFRDLVQVSIAERFQDRLQRLVRSTDIDDDSVLIEAIGNKRGVHHEGRAVERLRRTKHIAAKRMSDHDVIANLDREQWQTSWASAKM